jgi:hypothetical protein
MPGASAPAPAPSVGQIAAAPAYRGRATALWSTAFIGSTPIGAPIIGAIGAASPRLALIVGAAACGAAAIIGTAILAHSRTKTGYAWLVLARSAWVHGRKPTRS